MWIVTRKILKYNWSPNKLYIYKIIIKRIILGCNLNIKRGGERVMFQSLFKVYPGYGWESWEYTWYSQILLEYFQNFY